MTISYNGSAVAALSVKNVRQAIAWYHEMLGFEAQFSIDNEMMTWSAISSPVSGLTIGLGQATDAIPLTGGATLTFGVIDIEAARASLEAKGVKFDGPTSDVPGLVKLASFRDLDGNQLQLAQTMMPPA